tara:strand:- start:1465 stop:1593 length:129 start_codon:yes stop_codon:yes gene_type:complete
VVRLQDTGAVAQQLGQVVFEAVQEHEVPAHTEAVQQHEEPLV